MSPISSPRSRAGTSIALSPAASELIAAVSRLIGRVTWLRTRNTARIARAMPIAARVIIVTSLDS
jgi:hypothetical protein